MPVEPCSVLALAINRRGLFGFTSEFAPTGDRGQRATAAFGERHTRR